MLMEQYFTKDYTGAPFHLFWPDHLAALGMVTLLGLSFIFFFNPAIGSNYLFIAHKPEFPTLIDMLASWPWYILELEVIALAICFGLHIPFLIKDWARGRETVSA